MQVKRPSILVMDSNPLVRKMCQMVLAKAGLSCQTAPTPLEGLKSLRIPFLPSLILLDIRFQSPSVEEILTGLEQRRETRNIPVILLLPQAVNENPEDTEFPTVLNTLEKPFGPAELLQKVHLCLKNYSPTHIENKRQAIEDALKSSFHQNLLLLENNQKSALEGDLQKMPLSGILQLMQIQNQTGIFRISNQLEKVWIFFGDGQIQFSTGMNLRMEFRLGQILLRKGLLRPAHLQKVLVTKARNPIPLGQYLLAKKYLKADQLNLALKEQTKLIFYEILRWKTGHFRFEPTPSLPDLAKLALLNLRLEGLLLEGYRRVDEMVLLEKEIGPLQSIIERTSSSPANAEGLTGIEKRIFQYINGQTTLEELAERTLLPDFELYKACQNLMDQEMVKIRPYSPQALNS